MYGKEGNLEESWEYCIRFRFFNLLVENSAEEQEILHFLLKIPTNLRFVLTFLKLLRHHLSVT